MPTVLAVIFTLRSVYSKKFTCNEEIQYCKRKISWFETFFCSKSNRCLKQGHIKSNFNSNYPTTLKTFYAASHRILRKKMQYPLLQTVGLSLSTVKQKIFPSQKCATKYISKKSFIYMYVLTTSKYIVHNFTFEVLSEGI